ncbi:hypothetical protein DPMN_040905 [Dreissena polymorpha]|uniref:Uncharacterized protein n=1 Tax=Dreissena polymorpha TaxID=45954 RepID=A0A9D4CYF3_DREPO|nr:hypothetical protein DPMN_040905 [Dreissena polymorpha]
MGDTDKEKILGYVDESDEESYKYRPIGDNRECLAIFNELPKIRIKIMKERLFVKEKDKWFI